MAKRGLCIQQMLSTSRTVA